MSNWVGSLRSCLAATERNIVGITGKLASKTAEYFPMRARKLFIKIQLLTLCWIFSKAAILHAVTCLCDISGVAASSRPTHCKPI